jgi:hypothetical protein
MFVCVVRELRVSTTVHLHRTLCEDRTFKLSGRTLCQKFALMRDAATIRPGAAPGMTGKHCLQSLTQFGYSALSFTLVLGST